MKIIRRLFFQIYYYFRRPPWDTGITPPELMDFIEANLPGRALDLGCGTGTNAITLAQNGWQVTGIDFVNRAIQVAQAKAHQGNLDIDFQTRDVTRLDDLTAPFDLVLDIGCFHSLSDADKKAYVHNLRRLLAENGTFLLYAYFRLPDESPNSLSGGLGEIDLDLISSQLNLIQRQDGTERGKRLSSWLWYKK